jgi:peptide/nickel transport system substrate-binding protein
LKKRILWTQLTAVLLLSLIVLSASCTNVPPVAQPSNTPTPISTPTSTPVITPTPSTTPTPTSTPTPTPKAPTTLRIDGANLGFPSPYTISTQGRGYLIVSLIFDTLTWKDDKGVIPMLAKSWTVSTDNKTWTMKLATNAKFTDGQALTADDVKFSFDYIKAHPNQWVQLGMVQSTSVIDPTTVQIVLSAPYAPFLTDVAGLVPIMPQHIWTNVADPAKFSTPDAVIGSGPYKLTSFDSATGT